MDKEDRTYANGACGLGKSVRPPAGGLNAYNG